MPPTPRPLPQHVEPVTGESFVSWVDRVAAAHQARLGSVLERLGVPRTTQGIVPLYGVHMPRHAVEHAAAVARLDPAQVEAMLLSRYDGTATDLSGVLGLPASTDAAARARSWSLEWLDPRSTRYCPYCIEDDGGALQGRWHLATSAVRTVHQVMLAQLCPACGDRARYGAPKRGLPSYPSLVPEPGACTNPSTDPSVGNASPCGYPLAQASAGPNVDDLYYLAVAQAAVDSIADGTEPAYLSGHPVPAADFFRALYESETMPGGRRRR